MDGAIIMAVQDRSYTFNSEQNGRAGENRPLGACKELLARDERQEMKMPTMTGRLEEAAKEKMSSCISHKKCLKTRFREATIRETPLSIGVCQRILPAFPSKFFLKGHMGARPEIGLPLVQPAAVCLRNGAEPRR